MKNFIKKILIFITISTIFYIIAVIFFASAFGTNQKNLKFIPNKSWTKQTLKEATDFGPVDILFIGSSHAYRGYDVRLWRSIGKSFNLGTTGQTPVQTLYLLKKFYKNLNPKFVIIDIYFPLFESDGIESSVDILSNFYDLSNYKLFLLSPNPIVLNTLIYSYFYELKNRIGLNNNKKSEDYFNENDIYITGGFVQIKNQYYNSDEISNKRNIKMSGNQTRAFERIIRFLKKNKIKYIIVHAPITSKEFSSYANVTELDSYFKKFGIYINFNEVPLPLFDDIHFHDKHHLNQYGVNIFNKRLIEYFISLFPEIYKERK